VKVVKDLAYMLLVVGVCALLIGLGYWLARTTEHDPAPAGSSVCVPEKVVTQGNTTWTYCTGTPAPATNA
jgi:hypothetical protein